MFLVDFEIWCIRPAIRNVHFTVILVLIHSDKKIKYSQKLNFFVAKIEKQTVHEYVLACTVKPRYFEVPREMEKRSN